MCYGVVSVHVISVNLHTQVIVKSSTGQVLGLHFTGPNAGEVMQGYAVALR